MYYIIEYQVVVNCLDDGAHFPFHYYTDRFLLSEEKSEDEIRELVRKHAEDHVYNKSHEEGERLMRDPSFINLKVYEISIQKQLDDEMLVLEGPAKDYYGKYMTQDESIQAWKEIREHMEKEEK